MNEFITNVKFWRRQSKRGRKEIEPCVGDLVKIKYSGEIGILEKVLDQTCLIRCRGQKEKKIHRSNIDILVSNWEVSKERTMPSAIKKANAFLAVTPEETGLDIAENLIKKLQADLNGPSIKFSKRHTLHVTLGCFYLDKKEETCTAIRRGIKNGLESLTGDLKEAEKLTFLAAIQRLAVWDNPADLGGDQIIVGLIDPTHPTISTMRLTLEDNLGSYLEDEAGYVPHITLARNVPRSEHNKAAVNSINIGRAERMIIGTPFVCASIQLRWMKHSKESDERKSVESTEWFGKLFPNSVEDYISSFEL